MKPSKEDFGQTLGSYGLGSGCYFVLPILGPTTVRDSVGLLIDSYLDPFAHVTIREKELFSISGNNLDYYSIKSATAVDFRSDNLTNFDNLKRTLWISIHLLRVFIYKICQTKLKILSMIKMIGVI